MSAAIDETHTRLVVEADDPFATAEQLAQGILPLLHSILSHDWGLAHCKVASRNRPGPDFSAGCITRWPTTSVPLWPRKCCKRSRTAPEKPPVPASGKLTNQEKP